MIFLLVILIFMLVLYFADKAAKEDIKFETYMRGAIEREEKGELTEYDKRVRDRLSYLITRRPG